MEKKIAIYPGSFNPFTIGHLDILKRALKIFDEVYIVYLTNIKKKNVNIDYVLREKQMNILERIPGVKVVNADDLTVNVAKSIGANFIIRGLRNTTDFEYEKNIARINEILSPDIMTVFIMSDPKYDNISSSMVRELQSYNQDVSQFII